MTDMEQLQHDLKNIRSQMTGVFKEMENQRIVNTELETKLDRVITLLEGDHVEPERGFINRLIVIEKFVNKLDRLKSYYTGSVTAIIFIVGMIATFIMGMVKAYELIFKK